MGKAWEGAEGRGQGGRQVMGGGKGRRGKRREGDGERGRDGGKQRRSGAGKGRGREWSKESTRIPVARSQVSAPLCPHRDGSAVGPTNSQPTRPHEGLAQPPTRPTGPAPFSAPHPAPFPAPRRLVTPGSAAPSRPVPQAPPHPRPPARRAVRLRGRLRL